VKRHLLLLWLIAGAACAETVAIPFKQPDNFPLTFRLVLPKEDSTIVSHKHDNGFDTITARIDDDRNGGLTVESVDASGKRVWHHDFGYNASAAPGCSASISFHPKLNAVIVSYGGYKWDHDHKLLFVEKTVSAYKVREYSTDAPEILPFLKKQIGYSTVHKYWIHPVRFVESRVVFACIPLDPPERQSVHPLTQDVQWFDVTASIEPDFKIFPSDANPSH
jgi:hypothetical protein